MRRKVGHPIGVANNAPPLVPVAPSWVPQAVTAIARVIATGPDVARRLLTDERMKGVWRHLRRADVEVADDALAQLPPFLLLESYDIRISRLSNRDRACAAVFGFAVTEFSAKREVWTRARLQKFKERWNDATALCRWISADPMFDREFRKAASAVMPGFEKHARILKQKGRLVDFGENASAYYLGRSQDKRGDDLGDQTRGKTRALALMMGRLYGDRMYGITATVAAVATQTEVAKHDVRNWCRDLGDNSAN